MEVDDLPIEAFPVSGNVLGSPGKLLDDHIPFLAIIIHAV
jgi:hypothetical protein